MSSGRTDLSTSRPASPSPASPPRRAPSRPDPPVVCSGFDLVRSGFYVIYFLRYSEEKRRTIVFGPASWAHPPAAIPSPSRSIAPHRASPRVCPARIAVMRLPTPCRPWYVLVLDSTGAILCHATQCKMVLSVTTLIDCFLCPGLLLDIRCLKDTGQTIKSCFCLIFGPMATLGFVFAPKIEAGTWFGPRSRRPKNLPYETNIARPMAIFDPIFVPKIEDGGFFVLRNRKIEEPPIFEKPPIFKERSVFEEPTIFEEPPIFDLRLRNKEPLPSSIFGAEERRTPASSIFDLRPWSSAPNNENQ